LNCQAGEIPSPGRGARQHRKDVRITRILTYLGLTALLNSSCGTSQSRTGVTVRSPAVGGIATRGREHEYEITTFHLRK